MMFMDRIIPDFEINDGDITMDVTGQSFPVNGAVTKGPFNISKTTQKVDFRLRGRQAKIRVSCDSKGTSWRYGSLRLAMQPDGRR
jgi:cytochrome c-type biogenesis protein CcmE